MMLGHRSQWLCIALACLAGLLPAQSHARWYTVEVAVFERVSTAGLSEEHWPEELAAARGGFSVSAQQDSGVRVLTAGSSEASAIARVGRGQLAYGRLVNRLAASGEVRPLLHTGWRQPGLRKSEALPVRVNGAAQGVNGSSVKGTIRLYRSRYLHLEADLTYTRPDAGATSGLSGGTNPIRFVLRESRRMRSGELHYLDHPLFGMLVRATPYEAPGGAYVKPRTKTDGTTTDGEPPSATTPGSNTATQ
ncbi:MAG: CsiV family protein [Pseudomonadota bacterium]